MMNPYDPPPESKPEPFLLEPMPRGMLAAIKMWKWYVCWFILPVALLTSLILPPCIVIWIPILFTASAVWVRKMNRWALWESYFFLSIGSFVTGIMHVVFALYFIWECYWNETLDAVTLGIATIPNLLGFWLIVAAVLGWRFEKDYIQWLARQRVRFSEGKFEEMSGQSNVL